MVAGKGRRLLLPAHISHRLYVNTLKNCFKPGTVLSFSFIIINNGLDESQKVLHFVRAGTYCKLDPSKSEMHPMTENTSGS